MGNDTGDKTVRNFPRVWEEHEKQEILFKATHTTPLQRLEWLEAVLRLFQDRLASRSGRDLKR